MHWHGRPFCDRVRSCKIRPVALPAQESPGWRGFATGEVGRGLPYRPAEPTTDDKSRSLRMNR